MKKISKSKSLSMQCLITSDDGGNTWEIRHIDWIGEHKKDEFVLTSEFEKDFLNKKLTLDS